MKYLSIICMILISFAFAWAQEEEAPVAEAPAAEAEAVVEPPVEAPVAEAEAVVEPPVVEAPVEPAPVEVPPEPAPLMVQTKTLPPVTALMTQVKATDVMPPEGFSDPAAAMSVAYKAMIGFGYGKIMGLMGPEAQTVAPPWVAYPTNPMEAPVEMWDCICYVPVAEDFNAELPDGVQIINLPERLVAFATHIGPYEEIDPVWQAVMAWIPANGYMPAGPGEEVYLNDPDSVPPAELITEVQMPIVVIPAPVEEAPAEPQAE